MFLHQEVEVLWLGKAPPLVDQLTSWSLSRAKRTFLSLKRIYVMLSALLAR